MSEDFHFYQECDEEGPCCDCGAEADGTTGGIHWCVWCLNAEPTAERGVIYVVNVANDPGPTPDLDIAPDPTDVHEHRQPHRPHRRKLHGADDPRGFFDNRGAARRTVRREP